MIRLLVQRPIAGPRSLHSLFNRSFINLRLKNCVNNSLRSHTRPRNPAPFRLFGSGRPRLASNPSQKPSSLPESLLHGKPKEAHEERHSPLPPLPTWMTELPPALVPYLQLARADKPIGTWLLLLPCFWSIALATPGGCLPSPFLMGTFAAGAFVMRGAGCTINDLWDKDYDKKVFRTQHRPLAAGTVQPFQAVGFLGAQLLAGLGVLLTMNYTSIVVSIMSLPLVAAYPLCKRFFDWPQLVLGLTFNWGAFVGWAAVHDSIDPMVVVPLYLGGVSWTLLYDTIYAHQDKDDDAKLGLHSSALTLGDHSKPVLAGFGAFTMACMAMTGHMADLGPVFWSIGLLGGSTHLSWQLYRVDLDNRTSCMSTFKANRDFGAIILSGIVLDRLLGLPLY